MIGAPDSIPTVPLAPGDLFVEQASGRIGRTIALHHDYALVEVPVARGVTLVRRPRHRLPQDAAVFREQASGTVDCGICEDCAPSAPAPDPADVARQSIATDTLPLYDDSKLDPAVTAKLAIPQNITWWEKLGLAALQPVRGIDPNTFPNAYANRVVAFQRMAREQEIDERILGRAITPDGVLGPDTLLLLRAIVLDPDLDFFAADVIGLGFSLDRIRELGEAAQRIAEPIALPPEMLADWGFEVAADQMVAFYEQAFESDKLAFWQSYFAGSADGSMIEWPQVFELLRLLLGKQKLIGRIGVARFRRPGPRDGDLAGLARKAAKRRALHIWWDLEKRYQAAQKTLGFATPKTASVQRALEAYRATSASPPYVRRVAVVAIPDFSPAERQTVFDSWLPNFLAGKVSTRLDTEAKLRDFAASVMNRTGGAKDYAGEHEFATWVAFELRTLPHATRSMFFDAVKALPANAGAKDPARGQLDRLFSTFGAMVHYANRSVMAELVKDTTYVQDAGYVKYLAEHERRTDGIRAHSYDFAAKKIFLDKDTGAAVIAGDPRTGGIVNAVKHVYTRDEKIQRIKPARLRVLCKQLVVELQAMVGELLATADKDGTGVSIDEKKFFEDAVTRAGKTMSPPLGDGDVENVAWEMTVQILDLRPVIRGGVELAEIEYQMVERFGSGHWQPIAQTRRWRSEEEFGEELFFLFLDTLADVVTIMAYIAMAAVAFYFLFGQGLALALIKLAGGGAFVLASVGISVALYLIMEGRDVTWEGLFGAILMGYLQALGFRLFAPAGRWVGSLFLGKITAQVLTGTLTANIIVRGLTGIVFQKAITGAGGGAFAAIAYVFTTDLIRIVREGGGLTAWEHYLDAAGEGAWMGLIGEFVIGPGLSFLGSTVKGTSLHKAAAALGGGLEKLRALKTTAQAVKALQGVKANAIDLALDLASGVSQFGIWLRASLKDPKIAANGVKAVRGRAKALLDDFFTSTGRNVKKGGVNLGKSFYDGILDLAELGFSRHAARGLRRLANQVGVRLKKADLEKLIESLRSNPKAVDPVLSLLGVLDKRTLAKLLDEERLFELANATNVHALVSASSLADVRTLLQRGFRGSIVALEAWAKRVLALAEPVRLEVLRVVRETGASPSAVLALAEQGIVLDAFAIAAVSKLSAFTTPQALAALLREKVPDLDGLLSLAADPTAEPALRALLKDPDVAARLMHATESALASRDLIDAAGGSAKHVDKVLAKLPRRVAKALRLEATEQAGLIRLLRAAKTTDDLAGILKLLDDPHTAFARLRAAGRVSARKVSTAIAKGRFEPQYEPRKLVQGMRRRDKANNVPQLGAAERLQYRVTVRDGLLCRDDGTPIDVGSTTGSDAGLYAMSIDGEIYIRQDDPWNGPRPGRFHHSSFLSGKPVGAAGTIRISQGKVTYATRGSGHYDAQPIHLQRFLDELKLRGADLTGARIIE